ncbi:MAG: hypothetical protein ACE37F_01050 [Nannocystaceae bacterium]|nr:hypothetical protein [bacterium]
MDVEYVGEVFNAHHPATPIVLGDFELMKGWPGTIDGTNAGPAALGERSAERLVYSPQTMDHPVAVFRRGAELWMVSNEASEASMGADFEAELVRDQVTEPFQPSSTGYVHVNSGGLVITLSYNSTPAADVDTSEWDEEENFVPGETPQLPATVPDDAAAFDDQLIVLRVEPGAYRVESSVERHREGGWVRVRISPCPADAVEPYFEGIDWDDAFEYETTT